MVCLEYDNCIYDLVTRERDECTLVYSTVYYTVVVVVYLWNIVDE